MTYQEFNRFCKTLKQSTYVQQWGNAHVWKIGGKVYAIGGWQKDKYGDNPAYTFKTSPIAYEILREKPGLRPAPYLATRGMKWIQHYKKPGLNDNELKDFITQSYTIVARGLTKKIQKQLGLLHSLNTKKSKN